MVAATAAAVIDGLLRRVDCGAHQSWLPSKVDEGMRHVKVSLCLLRLALASAPEEQSFEVGARMRGIKQAVYELEDLLDDLDEHGAAKHRASGRAWKAALFWLSSPLLLHTPVAFRLNTISRKLDFVAENSVIVSLHQHNSPNTNPEYVRLDRVAIIGRDAERQDIKELFLESRGDSLSILPIVGLPGLGKTSLARLIFDDKEEGWDFDLRIWISFHKNFDLEKIAMCIISEANKTMKGKVPHISKNDHFEDNFGLIKDAVQEILHNSSCLIVLDNMLCANENWLNNFKDLLGAKQKHTKVIVTTCSEIVAELMHTVPSYNLGCLSEDDCWAIFCKEAFGSRDAIVDPWYTQIGKEIVRRCMGIPILAQSLGLMVHSKGMNTWLSVRDDELWKLEERLPLEAKMFSSFKEIYYRMPLALKSCFLYLSVMRRGSYIDKDELIRQWIALDFIKSNDGVIPEFVVGEIYIQKLVAISFLQIADASLVTDMKFSNPPTILKMHNLVYDFLTYIARDDLFTLDYAKSLNGHIGNLPFRYAILTNYSGQPAMHKDCIAMSKAVFFKNCEATMPIADMFSILRHSRLLDLSGCLFEELPASIGKLKHLRYLNISCFRIRALPDEMSCLQNLEYLDLSNTCIEVLPLFVGTFHKLKYFNLHGCGKLHNLPPNLCELKRLEHLNLSSCSEIRELPLSISGLSELRLFDLSSCSKLEQLPHPFGSLGRLENLNLAGCYRLKQLPESFGGLSFLRFLNLTSCSRLQKLPDSIGDLCSLEYLNISHIHPELPDSLNKLHKLHILRLTGCGLLKSLDMPQYCATCNEVMSYNLS